MATDRQLLTKEITMEFIKRTPWSQEVDTKEINRLVDNIIGEDCIDDEEDGYYSDLNESGCSVLPRLEDTYDQIPFLYMDYYGSVNYSDFLSGYYGSLLHIDSLVNYDGRDIHELWCNFKKSVESYIQISKIRNISNNG